MRKSNWRRGRLVHVATPLPGSPPICFRRMFAPFLLLFSYVMPLVPMCLLTAQKLFPLFDYCFHENNPRPFKMLHLLLLGLLFPTPRRRRPLAISCFRTLLFLRPCTLTTQGARETERFNSYVFGNCSHEHYYPFRSLFP